MKLNKLLKDLKTERVQGSSAVLNYSNFDYWVNWDDIVEIVENHKQPQLNENQQIVLEMLKEETIDRGNLYAGIYWLLEDDEYPNISNKEFYQVLAAFAEWGCKSNE